MDFISSLRRKLHTYMNHQSGFARFYTERSVNRNDVERSDPERPVNGNVVGHLKVYGKMITLEKWRKFVLSTCVVALAIDPLFFFIPEIDSKKKCFTFDKKLGKIVCVLRTLNDTFYVIHIIVSFITEVIDPRDVSQKSLRDKLIVLAKAVRRTLFSFYLIVDIVSVIPIPQVEVLSLIVGSYISLVSKRRLISFTKWIIIGQYIPRIIRIYPLYKQVTITSGTIAESHWIGAGLNLFLFLLCSYVFGALWYVNAIEKKGRCWRDACDTTPVCITKNLFCASDADNHLLLNSSCLLIDPDEITDSSAVNFGMYIEVFKSGVAEVNPRDFPRKLIYCFWWGLRHLSTFGQGLVPSNSTSDSIFAIIVCVSGLFLFAVLIGNVQKYMISSTVRVEEMKERKRDTENWMSSKKLPKELKESIRKYDNFKWRKFRGTEEDALLSSLPKDLRIKTKCHLYLNLLKCVPLLKPMNDWVLEAVCDRVKSVFYLPDSIIVKEGDPVEEVLIVTKGKLKCEIAGPYGIFETELKKGDICGDLTFWILNPSSSPYLPISNRTVTALTEVEGFILLPDDLKFVASHLYPVQSVKDQDMFRSLSEQQQSGCSSSPDMLLPVLQRSDDPEFSKD